MLGIGSIVLVEVPEASFCQACRYSSWAMHRGPRPPQATYIRAATRRSSGAIGCHPTRPPSLCGERRSRSAVCTLGGPHGRRPQPVLLRGPSGAPIRSHRFRCGNHESSPDRQSDPHTPARRRDSNEPDRRCDTSANPKGRADTRRIAMPSSPAVAHNRVPHPAPRHTTHQPHRSEPAANRNPTQTTQCRSQRHRSALPL